MRRRRRRRMMRRMRWRRRRVRRRRRRRDSTRCVARIERGDHQSSLCGSQQTEHVLGAGQGAVSVEKILKLFLESQNCTKIFSYLREKPELVLLLLLLHHIFYINFKHQLGNLKKYVFNPQGGGEGFRQSPKSTFVKTFTKSTIHISPSFHDICENWCSKNIVHNQGGGFQVRLD